MANYISQYSGTQIDTAVGKIIANAEQSGKVLTSDGNGSSSWQNAPSGGTEYTGENGIYVNDQTGKIGISQNGVATDRLARPSSSFAYPILTATPSSDATWTNLEYEGVDVKSSAAQQGLVLTSDGSGGADWAAPSSVATVEGVNIKSTGVTEPKFLRSNGTGGATWDTPSDLFETTATVEVANLTITDGYFSLKMLHTLSPDSFPINDFIRFLTVTYTLYHGYFIPATGFLLMSGVAYPVIDFAAEQGEGLHGVVRVMFNFQPTSFTIAPNAYISAGSTFHTRRVQ